MLENSIARSPEILQFLAVSVDESPEGILAFDTEFRYVLWNRQMEAMAGAPREQVLGRVAFEVFPFLVDVGEDAFFRAALRGESSESRRRPFTVQGGRTGYFDASYRPIRDAAGEIIGGVAHLRECSEQIRVEHLLRRESEMLETLLQTAEAVSADRELQNIVQAATDAATHVAGAQFGAFFYNVINARGESYMLYTISGVPREAFSKFPMPRNTEVFAPTFNGEGVVRSGNIRKDPRYGKNAPRHGMPEGHLPVTSYLAVPVMSRSGEVFGGLFFGHSEEDRFSEMSERLVTAIARQASIAIENSRLYASERRAREQAEQSEARMSAIWSSMTDAFIFLDRDWKFQYVNQRACEFAGRSREELLGQVIWEVLSELNDTKLDRELRAASLEQHPRHFEAHDAGEETWLECHAYPSPEGVSLYFRDVTAEKQAKQEVRKVEDRLKLVATTTGVGTWYCDLPFDTLEWSAKTKEHFWLPENARVTIDDFYERLHPEDREPTRLAIEKSIQTGGRYDIDYRTVSEKGEIKWIRALGRAFYDEQGNPIRFDGVTVDQTARRNSEEALRRSERLATAGRLAATVAHEVNNPLEAVTNLIYLCQHDPEVTDKIRARLKMADEELRRVAHIVRQTLGFYRETSAPQLTNLSELVQGLIELYRKRYQDKQIKLTADLDYSVSASVVPGGIRQVVANLLSNALDACSPGDEVTVIVRTRGKVAVIEVVDTGHGIAPQIRQRLFEPFFTTKTEVGTGLGLWVSKGIIEKHEGRLDVHSSTDPDDHGTVFTISLPHDEIAIAGIPA
jgi:PAS domain S-box-containing protein